ncbi:exodeoxyribonuclease VII [Neisseria polysaccharea]|uniref:exodeoxyribonuclease VII n=1 Tax=Neisseria polysaccharea TaxID=489 RepID=UPI0027E1320E|nr:exodeoxyribonuclease VII [Neisseria polysaccharea]
MPSETLLSVSDGILTNTVRRRKTAGFLCVPMLMFQHTGRHIKRRPMCHPDSEGVTPLPNIVD